MPRFETPEPIFVRIEAGSGSVRLVASERVDTVVTVRPRDESRSSDLWAADNTRVDFSDGKLSINGAKRGLPLVRGGAIDIDVALPAWSKLQASLESADLCAEGQFADVKVDAASGDVEVDVVTGNLKASNASGSLSVRTVEGRASFAIGSGAVTIGDLDGELKFKGASGSFSVERLWGNLKARTASGSVAIAEAVRGAVSAHTSSGQVTVGVAEGTAARLDISTASGVVTTTLQPTDGPLQGDETLILQVRSASGDVDVQRAVPVDEARENADRPRLPEPAAPPAP